MGSWRGRGLRMRAAALVVGLASWLVACGVRSPGAEAFPELVEFAGREITRVVVVAPEPFTGDTLAGVLETEPTHYNLLGLPIRIPFTRIGVQERRLNLDVLYRDVARLALFYRRSGYFGTLVEPEVRPRNADDVEVRYTVVRGDAVFLDTLDILGVEGVLDPAELRPRLPLQPGGLFHLGEFAATADTVLRALRARGHAYAEVVRSYDVDFAKGLAVAVVEAEPGPPVVVDGIVVTGAENLGRRAALQQLTIAEGDLLRLDRLVESQRNLYGLELVQFATVEIAPDELQLEPEDRSRATLLVSVSEAPVHVVDALVGFGTVECFRTWARWVSRSFAGGARRLAVTGSIDKIGIADPLDFGLAGSICGAFRDDPFRDELDYRLSADLTQPWFLSPRNHLTASAFAERESEPNVFQRESLGGRFSLNRQVALRTVLTLALNAERGRTLAAPGIFCFPFEICDPLLVEELAEPRWRNSIGASWVRDRTDRPMDPTAGRLERTGVAWAAPWLLSDVVFLRWTGELATYRTLAPEQVAAARIQLGTLFGAAIDPEEGRFLPPEERFFAGGPNSVRGFDRNAMGPGVYVAAAGEVDAETGTVLVDPDDIQFFPVGGTSVAVATGELRIPSPVLRDFLRAAVFVDVGALSTDPLWRLGRDDWRVTPGVGVRFRTPIGPIRLDAAYNPHTPVAGPLFLPDAEAGVLVRVADAFRPEREPFLGRIRFHLAVGQAF
jgi:outer membrane protein insertion porin family